MSTNKNGIICPMNCYDQKVSIIDIDSVLNLRDLGGIPMSGDRTFPYNVFYRSGTLAEATDDAMAKLHDRGVTTVIDLRSASELKKYGNKAMDNDQFDFHSIPLFLGDPDSGADPTMNFLRTHHLGDFYVNILEELGSQIVKVINVLADCEGIGLFHCAHGKDRTGVICAIIYLLAGVSREDIINNYAFSYEYIKWFLDPLIADREEELKHTLRSDRINMEIMLDHIVSNYGGDITKYLLSKGMSQDKIDQLKSKFN